jgi:hypothetical protein
LRYRLTRNRVVFRGTEAMWTICHAGFTTVPVIRRNNTTYS